MCTVLEYWYYQLYMHNKFVIHLTLFFGFTHFTHSVVTPSPPPPLPFATSHFPISPPISLFSPLPFQAQPSSFHRLFPFDLSLPIQHPIHSPAISHLLHLFLWSSPSPFSPLPFYLSLFNYSHVWDEFYLVPCILIFGTQSYFKDFIYLLYVRGG